MSHAQQVPTADAGPRAPDISVIIPCLDAALHLDACLRSVLEQRDCTVELVVVDGGSRDGSVDLLERLGDRIAWWCSEPDSGPADAVRKGLAHATADVVAVLNADDYYLPGALATALGVMDSGADWLVGQVDFVNEAGHRWPVPQEPRARWTEWLLTVPVCQPGSFWRRSILQRAGPLHPDVRWLWDYDVALRLYFDLGLRPRVVEQVLACYRLHPGSLTVRARERLVQEAQVLRRARREKLSGAALARLRVAWWQRWQRTRVAGVLRPGGLAARLRCGLQALPGLGWMLLDSEAWRAALARRSPRWREAGTPVFDVLDAW